MVKNMGEISMLYDFYGDLLTDRQKTVLEYYYGDDYTLSEIAEHTGISRQAVHDTVHKAERALHSYEAVLGLADRYHQTREQVGQITAILKSVMDDTEDDSIKNRLKTVMKIITGLE